MEGGGAGRWGAGNWRVVGGGARVLRWTRLLRVVRDLCVRAAGRKRESWRQAVFGGVRGPVVCVTRRQGAQCALSEEPQGLGPGSWSLSPLFNVMNLL